MSFRKVPLTTVDLEIIRCRVNASYFAWNHCKVLDEQEGQHIPFCLWPAQVEVLNGLVDHRLVCLLKGRQIGMTTLVLAYLIWVAILKKPGSTILLFSKGQKEARELIERIRSMILNLPDYLQPRGFTKDSTEELSLTNGSRFVSFASRSSGGDSYTASVVVVDEADLIPDLNRLLTGAKPTISAGGQLILLSRVDKSQPESSFKQVYRAAVAGKSEYWAMFLPWWSRPGRNRKWYESERREILSRTGSEDELWENHPATPEQALAARQLDKRLPLPWLEACFELLDPIDTDILSGLPGLRVFKLPIPGRRYVIGCDPAQGNPNSDNSVAMVLEWETLEEVATLCGKFEMTSLASYAATLSGVFNGASVMVERNNHGHTVILEFQREYQRVPLLKGRDGKVGWLTNLQPKTAMFNAVAEAARHHAMTVHDRDTFKELADLEASTLKAPKGLMDDRAIAFGLCVVAVDNPPRKAELFVLDGSQEEPVTLVMNTSETPGVKWVPSWESWVAEPEMEGVKTYLGEFESEELASAAVREFLGRGGQI